jgi:hypothetical protein
VELKTAIDACWQHWRLTTEAGIMQHLVDVAFASHTTIEGKDFCGSPTPA